MISSLIIAVAGGLGSCAQTPSNECAAIDREQAIRIADTAKQSMLSRSTSAVENNFEASSAHVLSMNDGGFAAEVAYSGRDGKTLIALIHDDCYVGWTSR